MSRADQIEYQCNCGASNAATLWSSVNLTLDPTFAERIIDNRLFESQCRQCQQVNTLIYPLLFHDMQRHLMAWFVPAGYGEEYTTALTEALPPEMRNVYQLRLISDLDTFKEWVRIWRDGLDDLDMFLLKPKVIQLIEESHDIRLSACSYDTSLEKDGEPALQYVLLIEEQDETAEAAIPRSLLEAVARLFGPVKAQLFPTGELIEWSDTNAFRILAEAGMGRTTA